MSQREKNPFWDFFEKCSTDLAKAVCKICSKSVSLGSVEPKKQTLAGVKLHLSTYHESENRQVLKRRSEINDIKSASKQRKLPSITSTPESEKPSLIQSTIPGLAIATKPKATQWTDDHEISRRIDKAIMDLIIVDMLPYSLVSGEAFKRLNFTDTAAFHKYRLKSEKYFRTSLMPKTYETVKAKVQALLDKCEWLSATTDIWTNSSKTCSLLSFTAHFIQGDKRLKVILGACVLEKDHTGQYIAQKFTEMVNEWNLQNKLFLVLRDNAANMICAMRGQYESVGCVSHTLQLVIKQALFTDENTKEVLKKCRKIVGHFNHSEPATRKLTECQKQCGLPEHALIQDMEVRWNSTYLSLERLLEQKSAINLYSVEHGKIDLLNSEEWEVIKHLTCVLKCFYEATLDLSFDQACISIVIPLLSLLNRKLQVRNESDGETLNNMKKALHETLNKKFSYVKGSSLHIAATLLDPRFKSRYLTADDTEMGVAEIINFLLTADDRNENIGHRNENIGQSITSLNPTPTTSGSNEEKESLWATHDRVSCDQLETTQSQEVTIKQRILNYLSEPLLQRNADIYSYWNSSPYTFLRKAVLKFLSAPPTSVPSEQLFSAAGQIYADRRSNLLGQNAEKLLFLAYNIRLSNFEY